MYYDCYAVAPTIRKTVNPLSSSLLPAYVFMYVYIYTYILHVYACIYI